MKQISTSKSTLFILWTNK